MDAILGNEHTSAPALLVDLNDDGPLNLQVTRLHLSTSDSATPTPSSGDEQDDSSVQVNAGIPDPFNSGKKLKSKKKKDDEEDKEVITDLLRETIEEEKTWRQEEKKWKEEAAERDGKLLNVIETLVSHLVQRSSQVE